MATTRSTLRTAGVAARILAVFTVVLGVGYTAVVTGVSQLALPWQANGSLITSAEGAVVGSALLGQSFADADGTPLPEYFQSRPSAAGDGYDGRASSGSNLGPENADLVTAIEARRQAIAAFEGVDVADIPADAVTASASGLDPHISAVYARLQVPRVAAARELDQPTVSALVESMIESRDLGWLGEPRVNVLRLNIALDGLSGPDERG